MGLNVLFSTIHSPTVLFQITFIFIYNTFSKKFSVSAKQANLKQTLSLLRIFFVQ